MKKANTQERYVFYLRCSSDDQKHGDFTTIDTQRDINTEHICKQGGQLVGDYADEGKSGTNLTRPDWKRLLADAQAGKFDVVVVTYMSRLGRGNSFVIAEYELQKCGVKVEMVREQFTDDLAGYIGKTTTNMMDGLYPMMVSQWTRTKMEQMVANGFFCGGQPPLGYCKEFVPGYSATPDGKEPPKRMIPDPDQAEIVRFAFDLFLIQRKVAAVRDYLNSVTGRRYTTTSAKYLLQNEVYTGNYVFGKWRKDDAHPAIVDKEVWQTVQDVLEERVNNRVSRDPISDAFTYYLRGRVFCPHCGCVFTNSVAKGGAVRYYECLHHAKRKSVCPIQRVNARALHASFLQEIRRAATHPTVMHRRIAESGGWQNAGEAQVSLRGQLGKQKQMLDMRAGNYIKAIGEGRMSTAIMDALEKVEAEKQLVCEQLEQLEQEIEVATVKRPTASQIQEVWSEMLLLWDEGTEEERQEIAAAFVVRVDVKEKDRASMELMATPTGYGQKFVTKSQMGAGVGLEPTTFGL
jgi:site-specific DNA recombinase